MKFSFPTVVTLITVLVSASAESTLLRGGSMNEPTRQLAGCVADGYSCDDDFESPCVHCCNGSHLGDYGLSEYCGPQTSCWGKDTLCVPAVGSCDKCCNSWSMYGIFAYCD